MSQEYQEIIQDTINEYEKRSKLLKKSTKLLREKLLKLEVIETQQMDDLEMALKRAGKDKIDFPRFLDYLEDSLIKLAREDYILIFVPIFETELLSTIGNIGEYVAKIGNYIGFKFGKNTDPRWELPEVIAADVEHYLAKGFERELSIADGLLLYKKDLKDQVKAKYGKYLTNLEDQSATIKPKVFLDFMLDLGEKGYYIHDAGPYPKDIFRKLDSPSKIDMGDHVTIKDGSSTKIVDFTYQREVVKQLPKHRYSTIAFKTGSGKTFVTMAFFRQLKGKKLVLVDQEMARDQWKDDIHLWIPEIEHEIHVDTYQSLKNAITDKKNDLYKFIKDETLAIIVYDEGERVFNPEWGKSLAVKSTGRLFLTATPFPRNVTDLVMRRTLFGRMFATDWQQTMKAQGKDFAKVVVNILKNDKEKLARFTDRALKFKDRSQLIFCQWKTSREGVITGHDLAQKLSRALGKKVTFIHGDTPGRKLEQLRKRIDEDHIVITSLAKRSVSIKNLEITHIFNPLASETVGPQQVGRSGHSLRKNKQVKIYFTVQEITKELAQDWLYFLIAKGYPVEFPDGRPAFEKRSTILEQVAASFIEENKTTQTKPSRKVSAAAPVKDLASFFDHPIVDETINNMKVKKVSRLNLTLDIIILYQEKAAWTQDEIAYELGLNSKGNISTALGNLIAEKLVLKDSSQKPALYKLNIDAVNQLILAKKKHEERSARRKKYESKTG